MPHRPCPTASALDSLHPQDVWLRLGQPNEMCQKQEHILVHRTGENLFWKCDIFQFSLPSCGIR